MIHLVYNHGSSISTPDAIGRNLSVRLSRKYKLTLHNWDEIGRIVPDFGDVLLGHPHPYPGTVFRRSYKYSKWKRVIVMSPYNHGDNMQVSFLEPFIRNSDLYLAITGNFWFSSVDRSLFSHWKPKMKHLDLAVDRNDFPIIKRGFNEAGRRRFLYIGHSWWTKNTDYLTELAMMMPDVQFAWIGKGRKIRGLRSLGYQDFSSTQSKELLAKYDFLVTVGRADSNPTTILEAMAWGLIPICTPQSGYVDYPGIINIPLDKPDEAVNILNWLQGLPSSRLEEMQLINWHALDTHFNWDRFSNQVIEAIEETNENHPLDYISIIDRLQIFWEALRSPYSPWVRPHRVVSFYFKKKLLPILRSYNQKE